MDSQKRRRRVVESAEADSDASMFVLAQNRALATNLFRYKRRVEELETANSEAVAKQRLLLDIFSILRRRLALVWLISF